MFALLTSLMMSATTFAYPNVGDQVVFDATLFISDIGKPQNSELIRELIAYDKNTDQFHSSFKQIIHDDDHCPPKGCVGISSAWVDRDKIKNRETILAQLSNCESLGIRETITLPAGVFGSCKIEISGNNSKTITWVGDAPFGILKQHTQEFEGPVLKVEFKQSLKSFSLGSE